ncbi:hypothetical protein [Shouchella patagoniensis]|uniref:hypothetical protein n=1 Tax=Shouchella patagoniensis TaxID=228576 RepID=UPI000995DCA4|nr:hypothetical protein [Shouchella patagoniensis]
MTGRRLEKIASLKEQYATTSFIAKMNVTKSNQAIQQLEQFIQSIGAVDITVISAGTGHLNSGLNFFLEQEII